MPPSPRSGARSSPPSRPRSAASCPPGTGSGGAPPCARRSCPLQGLALPVSLWESEVLPRRVPGYQPSWLDGLCAAGELVWVGAGLDRVAVYFREDAPVLGRPAGAPPPETPEARRDPRRARPRRDVLGRPARRDGARGGGGAARAVGARLGRRGDERRLDAAPRRPPLRGAAARNAVRAASPAPAAPRSHRRRAAGRRPTGSSRARPTGARSPSSCSSGRGSSPATASAARGFPAATAPSTRS